MSLSTCCFLVAGLVYISISCVTILQHCYCNTVTIGLCSFLLCERLWSKYVLRIGENRVVKKVAAFLWHQWCPVEKQTNPNQNNKHLRAFQNLWFKKYTCFLHEHLPLEFLHLIGPLGPFVPTVKSYRSQSSFVSLQKYLC